jgi:uncharacterized membrane protein YbhN (UPF0104 family)
MFAQPRVLVQRSAAMLVVLGACAVCARSFARIDLAEMRHVLGSVGGLAPLALVPFAIGMMLDALGQLRILRALGHRISLGPMFVLRVATEALHVTAPAGFVVADSAMAALLSTRFSVSLGEGAVLAIGRKWLVARAHAVYVLAGAYLGAACLSRVGVGGVGGRAMPWLVASIALVPFALSLALGMSFRGGPRLVRLHAWISRCLGRDVGSRSHTWTQIAKSGDACLARVGSARTDNAIATGHFLGVWLAEAADTAVVLFLVGRPFDLRFALATEVCISVLRSIGNIAPAGLGVQDVGYASLLPAMGVPLEVAAAFVLAKRCKEAVTIGVGYALLAVLRRGSRPAYEASAEVVSIGDAVAEM